MEELELQRVGNNIFYIGFDSRREMCKAMLRFQEHYESPKFKNKIFSLAEFKKWYRTQSKNKTFSYYSDWAGFNVPSYIFNLFLDDEFKRLSGYEKQIINLIKDIKMPFYLIASKHGSIESMEHEMVQALYFVNEKYRKQVNKILESLDLSKQMKALKKTGYCKDVMLDEINAYSVCYREKYAVSDDKIVKKLVKLYNKYKGE